jgi:hypothetical protein
MRETNNEGGQPQTSKVRSRGKPHKVFANCSRASGEDGNEVLTCPPWESRVLPFGQG